MVQSIDVRKYSSLREVVVENGYMPWDITALLNSPSSSSSNWNHFPYRDDISISFIPLATSAHTSFNQVPNCKIKILWKATILEELHIPDLYTQFNSVPLLILAKYPTIAIKYLIRTASVLIKCRFQISFHNQQLYDECVLIFKNHGFSIREYEQVTTNPPYTPVQKTIQVEPMRSLCTHQTWFRAEPNLMSQESNRNNNFEPLSQIVTSSSQWEQTSNHLSKADINSSNFEIELNTKYNNDEELKQKIVERLNDEEFVKFISRIDYLLN